MLRGLNYNKYLKLKNCYIRIETTNTNLSKTNCTSGKCVVLPPPYIILDSMTHIIPTLGIRSNISNMITYTPLSKINKMNKIFHIVKDYSPMILSVIVGNKKKLPPELIRIITSYLNGYTKEVCIV